MLQEYNVAVHTEAVKTRIKFLLQSAKSLEPPKKKAKLSKKAKAGMKKLKITDVEFYTCRKSAS